ncbi:MAG: GTP-binding protein [Alphaproteobacteria bacterium]|nr:GTP-binding protein [Alphaproteobacteria bacterium]
MTAYSTLTPIFVLTGFLGSGKTTLLNHMLKHPALKNAAVLINEFGEVGIDHQLVETIDKDTVLLSSGCICCTIRDDLKNAILELHEKRAKGLIPAFERIVVETTGLADPSPIMYTLMADTQLRYHYRLGTIISTVDAVNGLSQLDEFDEALKQATVADRLVLTKTDLATPADIDRLRARLKTLNMAAEIIVAKFGALDVEALLTADLYDPSRKGQDVARWLAEEAREAADDHHHSPVDRSRHDAHIHSFCLTYDQPLDWTVFGIWLTMLLHTHGQNVLRVKGILNVAGVDTPVVINGVQHIVHPPFHLAAWPDDDRRSRIVFIVRDLTQARILDSLALFNRLAGETDRSAAA